MMSNIHFILIEFPDSLISPIEELLSEMGFRDRIHQISISSSNSFDLLQCFDNATLDKYIVSIFLSENDRENCSPIYLLGNNGWNENDKEILDTINHLRHVIEPDRFLEISISTLSNLVGNLTNGFSQLSHLYPEIQEVVANLELMENDEILTVNLLHKIIAVQQISIKRLQNQIKEQEIQHIASVASFSNILEDVARSLIWQMWEIFKSIVFYFLKIMPFLKRLLSGRVHRVGKEYQVWYEERKLTDTPRDQQIEISASFNYQPILSFIVPVYNPPLPVFEETIKSVLRQTYHNWELCLADGGDSPEIQALIKKYADEDVRIKYKFLEKNLGISGNSNESIKIASGEYILILDHDDAIEENLLFEIVALLNQDALIDCVYYDEDKIDIKGIRSDPNFKPKTFSPETLLCSNYLTHCAIRKSLVDDAGGFNSSMDGAQDWDLVLQVSEKTTNIVHIPKILYHWRSVPASAASSSFAKPYAFDAQIRCVSNHLIRAGLSSVSYVLHGNQRKLTWDISRQKISIITYIEDWNDNTISEIQELIDFKEYPELEIIGITSKEHHDYAPIPEKIKIITAQYATSFGAYDFGAKQASGDKLLFIHPDIQPLSNNWINELLQWSQKTSVGAVCGKIMLDQSIYQYGCVKTNGSSLSSMYQGLPEDSITLFNLTMNYLNFGYISEYITLISADLFAEIGGFSDKDTSDIAAIKFSDKIRNRNKRIVYTPFAKFCIKPALTAKYPSNGGMSELSAFNDPYFNPSLRLNGGIPLLPSKNI